MTSGNRAAPAGVAERHEATAPGDNGGVALAHALRPTLFRLYQLVRREAPTADLTIGQGGALATLATSGPMRMGALAATEGVRLPSMTETVSRLETLGLVERTPDPNDGRAVLVAVTPAGRALYDDIVTARDEFLAGLLAQLDSQEREQVAAALPALDRLLTLARAAREATPTPAATTGDQQ